MKKIDLRNPPNEMPDIVGYKRENPLAANFKPYISARTRIRELTPVPLIIGTLLGIIFGASSLYLVLRVGLTVSASALPFRWRSFPSHSSGFSRSSVCVTRPYWKTISFRRQV